MRAMRMVRGRRRVRTLSIVGRGDLTPTPLHGDGEGRSAVGAWVACGGAALVVFSINRDVVSVRNVYIAASGEAARVQPEVSYSHKRRQIALTPKALLAGNKEAGLSPGLFASTKR